MKLKAVVFDVGETIVNECRLWRAWAEWLNVPEHTFLSTLGAMIERGEHHRRVFETFQPDFDFYAAREQRRLTDNPDQLKPADLYPDALPCITELRRRGLRIGIAGNQPADIEEVLTGLGLPIDFVASSESWGVEKPSPGFFQKIVEELNIAPASIAYVGDRLDNDVIPALEAGMVAVFLRRGPWGYVHAQRPEVRKAHIRVQTLAELPEALDSYDRK